MTTAEKTKNLEHIASLRRTTITTESATPKIWDQMLEKRQTGKNIFDPRKCFFSAIFSANLAQATAREKPMAPLDQALLSNGCGYPLICPERQHVDMAGQGNFREWLLLLVTTLKLRSRNGGDLEGNRPHQCVQHIFWVVTDLEESRNGGGRVAF